MKTPFFVSLLLVINLCFGQDNRKNKYFNEQYSTKLINISSEVGLYEKLELGIKLPYSIQSNFDSDSLNAFDPKIINIEATFVSEKGAKKTRFGFYYQNYTRLVNSWKPTNTPYKWRVRFAPNEIGKWTGYIKVETQGKQFLDTLIIECIESSNKGFLELDYSNSKTNRYMRFSKNKESFFAIGENMVWPSFQKLKPNDMHTQFKWMQELAELGGNFIRIGLIPESFGCEWERLGNYKTRMREAWELDNVFNKAKELDIYMMLWLDIHGEFTAPPWKGEQNSWNNNPYNTSITGVNTPLDFLQNKTAIAFYKQKLRYIVSRWGYSTNLAIYEPLSEIDNFLTEYNHNNSQGKTERKALNEWYINIKNHFVNELHETRPVSVSFTSGESDNIKDKIYKYADISFFHYYSSRKDANKKRFEKTLKMFSNKHTKYKPVMYNEIGARHTPNLDNATGLTLHNTIWATSMMGNFGCGLSWWWDNAVHPNKYYTNFKGLSSFFKNIDFVNSTYTPYKWQSNTFSFDKSEIEMYYLKNDNRKEVIGWIHNNSYWWWNLKNSNKAINDLFDSKKTRLDKADVTNYNLLKHNNKTDTGNLIDNYEKIITLKFSKLQSKKTYLLQFYNTITGEKVNTLEQKLFCKNGKIKFIIPDFTNKYGDYSFKLTLID